jgi:3D (Asp-Asp-Asp) domain-containing protein/peptidoglycan hydrolase CwlO-like protein
VVRCRVVPGEMRKVQAWPAVAALLLICCLLPAKVSADSSGTLRSKAAQLQQQNATLAAQSRSAVLELYALDSKLAREQAHVVALRIETAQVRAERVAAQQRLAIAKRSLAASQRALSLRAQQLYEQGDSDPVAVVLGSSSVSEAMDRLDTINRVADLDRMVIDETRLARTRYRGEARALSSREQTLATLTAQAAQTAAGLEQARSARAAYVASLAAKRQANAGTISSLEAQAQQVETRASQLGAVAAARGGGAPPIGNGSSLTVVATGYALKGHTATGAPVGWGVVAVDPSVIPLGTRMSIPGYGSGVAADTGGAIVGNRIDLWFPSLAQAQAWGRRTVTITLQ